MEKINILTRGGIYLAKLDPAKTSEVGKIRPVAILNAQNILDASPPVVFICPLSSKSHKEFESLHIEIFPRDNLTINSYALVEHCRAISNIRIMQPRIAQLTSDEIQLILHRLKLMLD